MGAISDVELRTVQGAGEQRAAESSFGEPGITMGAVVVDGMQFAVDSAHHDSVRADIREAAEFSVRQL